jgi:hypothetical protein
MSTYNTYNDIQAYEALEKRRAEIQLDPQYQQWVRDLRVSQSYVEPSSYIKARELNNQYDYSNSVSKSSFLNFLKLKGIW